MAELSYFWDNPGTGDSPVGGYDNEDMYNVLRMLFNGAGLQGILLGWLDELEVTVTGLADDTAWVAPGGAIADGMWYESDDDVAVDVTAFRGGNCHIVVEADWVAQTVRLTAVNPVPAPNPGALTDVPVWEVSVGAGGIVALVADERDYCEFCTDIQPGTITTTSILDDAVTTAKLEDHTRWITRGLGELEADSTNPASLAGFGQPY
jgi:hypothetical protein